jgi:hypothetical protein
MHQQRVHVLNGVPAKLEMSCAGSAGRPILTVSSYSDMLIRFNACEVTDRCTGGAWLTKAAMDVATAGSERLMTAPARTCSGSICE